jgi:1-aminocyclopropane-1-carboxylate deaminase
LKEKKINVDVLRLDRIHPIISGNKWFKLKYYIEEARKTAKKHILTFGGAYSNHIIATAAAGKLFDLRTTGIIRGEKPKKLSPALNQATEHGMTLIFVPREAYRKKQIPAEIDNTNELYLIDEGGYGANGARGAAEILHHCEKEKYSHIACAVGTSTMLAGVIKAILPVQEAIGISVLRNNLQLENHLFNLLNPPEKEKKLRLFHQYHFGGYAKYSAELVCFMNDFYKTTGIPSDFVYTAKLFYAILDMIGNNLFPEGSNILAIHSGGLQGNLSLTKGKLIF